MKRGVGGDLGIRTADAGLDGATKLMVPAESREWRLDHPSEVEVRREPLGPVVLAQQARVALGDAIGAALRAQLVLVLIGERPGMSAHDSLGAYLTHAPQPGRTDAERNCVSNIRPQGLGYAQAAHQLYWLVEQALTRGMTGITLKDESGPAPLHIGAPPANIGA